MSTSKWWMGAVSAALVVAGCHLVAGLGDVDEVNGVAAAAAVGAVEVAVVERVGPSNPRATSHIPPEKIDFPAGAEVR